MQEDKIPHQKVNKTEKLFQELKHRILFYPNLYVPDFIIYDLAKLIEENDDENSN